MQGIQRVHQGTSDEIPFQEVCHCYVSLQKSGSAIVSDSERERNMVHDLLELKTKVDLIITEAFQCNEKFVDILREAFESVINRRQNKPAELIGEWTADSALLYVKVLTQHVPCESCESADSAYLAYLPKVLIQHNIILYIPHSQVRGHSAKVGEQGVV